MAVPGQELKRVGQAIDPEGASKKRRIGIKQPSFNFEAHGGLKFVRWAYTAKNYQELTVQKGDEVEISSGPGSVKDKFCKVISEAGAGRDGYIPVQCFTPRKIIQWAYESKDDGEVSVSKGEAVGVMDEKTGDLDNMCRIFRSEIGGEEGLIPQHCFYPRYEVYSNYKKQNSDELDVRKGTKVGLVEREKLDVFWKVFHKGRIGRVPRRCFEPPSQVEWDYEAKKDDEVTVKEGDTVTLVDDSSGSRGRTYQMIRLGSKVGYIPHWCFERRAEVYFDNDDPRGLSVKHGNIVGIVEETQDYLKVRFNDDVGLVPKKCFEIPAKVIKNYQKVKPNELTVKKGNEVRVMDATAYIKVRLGDQEGEIPLRCINIDMTKIVDMLKKKDDQEYGGGTSSQDKKLKAIAQSRAKGDESTLNHPLDMGDKSFTVDYLKDLDINEIGEIGMALGLSFATVRALSADNYRDEMVVAWLSRKDKVGTPTWKLLGVELQKLGKNDIAERIVKDNTQLEAAKLVHLEWHDDQQQSHELRIVSEVSHKWRSIGTMLGMNQATLDSEEQRSSDNSVRFQRVMEMWIELGRAGSYPATWSGLRKVLIAVKMTRLAQTIESALPFCV